MHSILVHLASLVVMLHMMFGCSWHHGLGPHACPGSCASDTSEHETEPTASHDCGCSSGHHHNHTVQPASTADPAAHCIRNGNHQGHHGCHADCCQITQVAKVTCAPNDVEVQRLGKAERLALIAGQGCSRCTADLLPDSTKLSVGVRAHLLLNVQLL